MDKKSSPAFTMSSRLKQTISKFNPGPMSYRQNIDLVKHSHPNAVIGKAARQIFKSTNGPAPGQYDIQRQLRPKSSSAMFSTYKQPEIKQSHKKLGPGTYDPIYDKVLRKSVSACKFNKSPKNSQRKQSQKQKTPGPMTYQPKVDKVHIHQPVTTFGHSLRIDETKLKENIPGPGKYNTETLKTYRSQSAFRFPQQKREIQVKLKSKQPGPLDYKIEGEFESNLRHNKGFKICLNRNQNHSLVNIPGPTYYKSQTKFSWKRAPAFSISHTQRKSSLILNKEAPGPNQYNPDSPPKKRAGSALITSTRRQLQKQIEKKQAIPGPGYYEKAFQYKTIGSGIKFTIPRGKVQKEKQKLCEKKPGPWSYNPIEALKQSIKYGTLGKSGRQSLQKKNVPGPGDYKIENMNRSGNKNGFTIGNEKRSKSKNNKQVIPGPNAYNIPSTIGNTRYYQKNNQKNNQKDEDKKKLNK